MNKSRQEFGNKDFGRRRFLKSTAAASLGIPYAVLGASGNNPGERLGIAAVGLGARGFGNLQKCEGADIIALCDVDWKLAATAFESCPKAAKYRDFRRMLDKEPGIDAVVISTPDHTHAVIAAEAMKRGKHVYLETPLAHDVWEARQLGRIAKETGVVTQMGNERHSGNGIRKAVEMLWGGGLGAVREVHCWTNRPQWPQGINARPQQKPVPENLDWDLWLGPVSGRGYSPAYHPYRWRGWRDFGTGALGAMGCLLLDVVFWGLKLDEAKFFTVEAECTGITDHSYPEASTIRYRFGPRHEEPPVTVIWYDGGRKPDEPENMPYLREIGSNGALFVGADHKMMFGPTVFGTNPGQVGPRTIPEHLQIKNRKPVKKIPTVKQYSWQKGNRHIQEWIAACKSGTQPCSNFEYAAPLTEMVLLGNAALFAGRPIEWDSTRAAITTPVASDSLIRREYRPGWSF